MKSVLHSLGVCAILLAPSLAFAKDFRLTSSEITPGASGKIIVDSDRNGNDKVKIEVRALAKPASLSPARQTYVVWFKARDAQPQNEGELRVDKNLNGELKTTAPFQQFDVFITAEDNPGVQVPTGPQVLHGTVAP